MNNQKPNNIQSSEDALTDAIDKAVNEFAREQALDEIGTDYYSPASVDEAMDYDSTIADNDEIYSALEGLIRSVITNKYQEYLGCHQSEWSHEKAVADTEDSMKGWV